MQGFIVLTKTDKGTKISAVEGQITIGEALQMLQAAQNHFQGLLLEQVQKNKKEESSEEVVPKQDNHS